jgi:membrane protein implicated in regulation of membrane protease activity
MVGIAAAGAVLGFGAAAFAQGSAPGPSVPWMVELVGEAPLFVLVVWFGRAWLSAHREGMESIRDAIDRVGADTTLNREAIDRLALRDCDDG